MIKTKDVAEAYIKARKQGHPRVIHVLRNLLVSGLSKRQREMLYMLPIASGQARTASDIARTIGLEVNNVDNVLNKLESMRLAEKTAVSDDSGLHYEWRRLPEGFDF